MLQLKTTASTYTLDDDSGYSFTITTHNEPERGWGATLVLTTAGMGTEEAAVFRLRATAMRFIAMAAEE